MDFEKIIKNLNKNGIKAYVVDNKNDVATKFAELVQSGSTIGIGGSMSVEECGIIDFIKNGNYNFVGRDVNENTDYYLSSSNAITQNGELYNVDGRSNRISNIAYGPKNVIMIVGINKIVKDLDEAILRVKTIAAPKNCVRLDMKTPCFKNGKCISLLNEKSFMTDGCSSNDRICCNYLVSAKQRVDGRIKIIFVKEELGF